MNNSDDNKNLQRGDLTSTSHAQVQNPVVSDNKTTLSDELISLSNRAANHTSTLDSIAPESAVNDLKNEIQAALAGLDTDAIDPDQNISTTRSNDVINLEVHDQKTTPNNSQVSPQKLDINMSDDLPITPKDNPVSLPGLNVHETNTLMDNEIDSPMSDITKDNHETLIASLQKDIQSDLSQETDENSKSSISASTGIGQTYYSDLSQAMNANKPGTMSELIRKSRFEEKEAKILSPRSRKNIAFIIGAIVLFISSIGILSLIFSVKEEVEFISQARVTSLVRSNQDTGINVTGLEPTRIKQAIRDVIEMDIPEDTINQIYYVQKDQIGNVRRLGVKDIFDKTNNDTPIILYDNIENEFTHGVYSTDKNYPFIILKALSYDRALDGLLEWEPTMIDDLATYLDLPPEGTDRSLLKPGFEDDLIKNKNVRVARFLPREVDRRGILDILRGNNEQNQEVPETLEPIDGEGLNVLNTTMSLFANLLQKPVFAQVTNTSPVTNFTFGNLRTNDAINAGDTLDPTKNNGENTICYNNEFPGQTFDSSFQGRQGYYCIDTIGSGQNLGTTITRTVPVCFNPATGVRIQDTLDDEGNIIPNTNPGAFCFESYQCYAYRCFVGDTPVTPITDPTSPRPPGYNCRPDVDGGYVYHETDSRYKASNDTGLKSCLQFTDLMRLQNVNSATLCFDDETGQLTQNAGPGVSCTSPLERQELVCIGSSGEIIPVSSPEKKICIQPLEGVTTNPISGDQSVWAEQSIDTSQCREITNNGELQERLIQASLGLRVVAGISSALGLSSGDVQNLNSIADFLVNVAYGGPTNVPGINEALEVVRQLDLILSDIDPYLELPQTGPNGQLNPYGQLLNIIQIIKCSFNIGNDLQWVTSDMIDVNSPIYAGQSSPTVEPLQQTLVQLGLMDPLSISGRLDIVTQDSIAQFQSANGLEVTGVFDPVTLQWIANILDNRQSIIVTNITTGSDAAIIADYFLETDDNLQLGSYNTSVQDLQIILYAEGYQISVINGLFDEETCRAVQTFQQDEGLQAANDTECNVSYETLATLDSLSRTKGYIGSGFSLNPQGVLIGKGALEGTFGPGVTNFVNIADADSLSEGDIVLMYTFLDEETILIARDQIVIDEVVRRRALLDIFE